MPPRWSSSSAPSRELELELGERQRRLGALDHGDDLGALGEGRDGLDQGRAGAAPGDQLAAGEADRVAAAKASLGVVARGGRDGADSNRGEDPASSRSALAAAPSAGSNSTSAASPPAGPRTRRRRPSRPTSPRAAPPPRPPSARSAEFGSSTTSSAAHELDRREQVLGRRVERRPAVDHHRAELLEQSPHPVAAGDRDRARAAAGRAAPAGSATCSCMSAMSSWLTSPAPANSAFAASGSSVWTWTLSVASSPTTSTESPSYSSSGTNDLAVEPRAGDDEVGAVAVLGVGVMDLVEPRGGVVRDLRQLHLLPGEPGDHPPDDHHEPERAGVDHAGLGEHLELLGRVAHRLLAGEQRRRQHLGEQRVLLVGARVGVEALAQPLRAALARRHRPSPGSRSASSPRPARGPRRRRRSAALVSAASISSGSISRPGGVASFSAAPRTIWLRITPEFPRAPISAARATSRTISGRRGSPSACARAGRARRARGASSAPCCRPVSPSATGKTLRSLISSRRASRWASATPTTWRKRTIDESGTAREPSGRGQAPVPLPSPPHGQGMLTAAARSRHSGTHAATRWSPPGAASTRTCRRSGSTTSGTPRRVYVCTRCLKADKVVKHA